MAVAAAAPAPAETAGGLLPRLPLLIDRLSIPRRLSSHLGQEEEANEEGEDEAREEGGQAKVEEEDQPPQVDLICDHRLNSDNDTRPCDPFARHPCMNVTCEW